MATSFFKVDDQGIIFLKEQWDSLLISYTSDKDLKDHAFLILQEKYSEKGRFYHNLSHVKALLNLFESVRKRVQDHQAIQFSIWFHDAIYDTKRSDNEEESAKLAADLLGRLQVNRETIDFVNDLILATKDHTDKNLTEDAKLFLDIDLAILGIKEEIYREYSRAIRAEYSWVPEDMYRTGRKKILKSFIERERIFLTDEMTQRFENQARKNIHHEIKSL